MHSDSISSDSSTPPPSALRSQGPDSGAEPPWTDGAASADLLTELNPFSAACETQPAHESQPSPEPPTSNWTVHKFFVSFFLWLVKRLENRRSVAAMISMVAHLSVLLILALWQYSSRFGISNQPSLVMQLSGEEEHNQLQQFELEVASEEDLAPPQENPTSQQPTSISSVAELQAQQISKLLEPQPDQPVTQRTELTHTQLRTLNRPELSAGFSSTGVEGRRLENRQKIAVARGGSLASEQAVEAALQWLANHQRPSGGWSLVHDQGECNGRCRHPGSHERFDPAATGLSLLAFLGAGYTHREGKYTQNIQRGLYYLRQAAEDTPQGASFLSRSDRGMYNHGIATFALCEAYQMTGDRDLQRLCQEAVNFIVTAQSYQGGWGYQPKQPGDLTITGWQMMALKSAAAGGLDVPPSTLLRARAFIASQLAKDGVNYFYREPSERSITCTSIGILLRIFLGTSWTDPAILQGLKQIAAHNDYGNDIYFRYYATLTLFHVGGDLWTNWNERCREYLISTQATEGHEAGSWYFENVFGREGGRLYTTAMAAMTLEVYYRYSPLYQQSDRPFEL